ncbi:MAG TPA: NAD(P)-dependent oxidoreductase [Holophagaceae bacterium]|nr:NAD(P)-dependent oxidoreductase [Holophagaceae bacterium]
MILATSAMVGPALAELGRRHAVRILPFRSEAWNAALPEARALLVLLSEPLTSADLERAPRLRAVATYSVGVNHLPLEACEARGIRVVSTPGTLTDATADLALTLLLALTRRVAEGEALVRSGQWRGWAPDQLLGMGLRGRTCGILGAGAIGRAFATRIRALGMDVAFWDREGRGGAVDFGPGSGPRLSLETLLDRSSVLSLHCPLTPDTRGLLGAAQLRRLPAGAVLINTARGGILDEGAALDLLHEGHLGGIGLDVYAGEPELDPRWRSAPRTVLLPHLGSATVETREAMARQVCDGIREALAD